MQIEHVKRRVLDEAKNGPKKSDINADNEIYLKKLKIVSW